MKAFYNSIPHHSSTLVICFSKHNAIDFSIMWDEIPHPVFFAKTQII
jgi:hypothetical protein